VVAAIAIIFESIREWMAGLRLEHLGSGFGMILLAGILNAGLGYYLVRTGRRTNSLILEANGKHVLTDSWTSFGVVIGLGLVMLTHWKPFDPIVAILVAVNILWSGGGLVWRSAVGLLDYSDPEAGRKIRERLDAICSELNIEYHGVRFRTTGYRQIIEVHLLFPRLTSVSDAHSLATLVEERLPAEIGMPARSLPTLRRWRITPPSTITSTTPASRSSLFVSHRRCRPRGNETERPFHRSIQSVLACCNGIALPDVLDGFGRVCCLTERSTWPAFSANTYW